MSVGSRWRSRAGCGPFRRPGPRGLRGGRKKEARVVTADLDHVVEENAREYTRVAEEGVNLWEEVGGDRAFP